MICVQIVHKPDIVQVKKGRVRKSFWKFRLSYDVASHLQSLMRNSYGVKKKKGRKKLDQ